MTASLGRALDLAWYASTLAALQRLDITTRGVALRRHDYIALPEAAS